MRVAQLTAVMRPLQRASSDREREDPLQLSPFRRGFFLHGWRFASQHLPQIDGVHRPTNSVLPQTGQRPSSANTSQPKQSQCGPVP